MISQARHYTEICEFVSLGAVAVHMAPAGD